MGLENDPYVVTKAVDEMVKLPISRRARSSYRHEHSEELGFQMTYISQEFHRQFLYGFNATNVEDLVFRKVNMDDIYE